MSDVRSEPARRWETLRAGDAAIHVLGVDAPVRLAARELAAYLPRLLPGAALQIYLGPAGPVAAASGLPGPEPEGEEGIVVRGDGLRYAVSGGSPAAILHAAYAFLEALGARWLVPGREGEVVRALQGPPPPLSVSSAPAFPVRGLTEGCLSWWPGAASFQDWLGEARSLVDWMGKMRMNRLFVHFNRLPPGDLAPLLPDLEKRGISLELGGHNLPKLLTPGLREAELELCRWSRGERRPDGNFCVSHPRVRRLLAEGAREYVEQLPPAVLYHLWSYDAKEDPWCSCPDCRALSPGEQMWRAVAAAAEGVAAARPGARVSGLLYHESLEARHGAPGGVGMLLAPRERCYLHAIDDPCPRNLGYFGELEAAAGVLGERLSLLEYYGDPILLGRPANRPAVVSADLAAYRAAGVRAVSSLLFGALSWWLYPVQLYAFARGCWNPTAAKLAAEDYCYALAGEAGGERLLEYYRLEGEAAGTHLRFCGHGLDGSWATLPFPPALPAEEARAHLEEMRRGRTLLREAGDLARRGVGLGAEREAVLGAAHALEEAFHRGAMADLARALGEGGQDAGEAFGAARAAMSAVPPETCGVFGTHWMLPWLRRCREGGRDAAL